VREFLKLTAEQMGWGQHAFFPADHAINPYSHLMTRVDPKQLDALGEPYRPYRSVVAWYCWRATELYGTSAASAVTR